MNKKMIYWGVLCRKCFDPVVFGSPSHPHFKLDSEFARPGTVRCAHGHDYIYFPRDFKFFASEIEISEATMERTREAHRGINPLVIVRSDQTYGTRWAPDAEREAVSPISQDSLKPPPRPAQASDGPDPRREAAQAAAKNWWAEWAARKVS